MLSDGLVEEQLLFEVMIFDEGRETILEGKNKGYVSGLSYHITPHKRYRGVIMKSAFFKEKFSQYLCFTVTIGSNDLIAEQEYTEQQHQNYELIKSPHDRGMGYRKIAKYLNEQGIKTILGNTWKNTQVFSVLQKYRERQERIQNVR